MRGEPRPIAAWQAQQIVRSASFTIPQWGQSQLACTRAGSLRDRIRQSTHEKTAPPSSKKRIAADSKSSTDRIDSRCPVI